MTDPMPPDFRRLLETKVYALMLPDGVSDLEAKRLSDGSVLSDADSYQWVKWADVQAALLAASPAPPSTMDEHDKCAESRRAQRLAASPAP